MNSNTNWENLRHKNCYIEHVTMMIIIIILVAGVFAQYHCREQNQEMGAIMGLLQTQVAVSAIIVASITIAGGLIVVEHRGVSLSNYCFNVKPVIFKAKRIMISTIIITMCLVIAGLVQIYWISVSLVLTTCILAIITITLIFAILQGEKNLKNEINMYLRYELIGEKRSNAKQIVHFENYCNSLKKQDLNEAEYKEELDFIKNTMKSMIKNDSKSALECINVQIAELVRSYASEDSSRKRKYAFKLLTETYNLVDDFIRKNNGIHINVEFTLYIDCYEYLIPGISNMPTEEYYRIRSWELTTDQISRVTLFCHEEGLSDSESLKMQINAIEWYPRYLARYICNNSGIGKKEIVQIGSEYHYQYEEYIPDDARKQYNYAKNVFRVAFYQEILKNCKTEYACRCLGNVSYTYDNLSYSQIVLLLSAICYTLYIAEFEGPECITKKEKEAALEVLEYVRNIDLMYNLMLYISFNKNKSSFTSLYDDIDSILECFECMPIEDEVKHCIVNIVVRDFFVFLCAKLSNMGVGDNFLLEILNKRENWKLQLQHYYDDTKEITRKLESVLLQNHISNIDEEIESIKELLE